MHQFAQPEAPVPPQQHHVAMHQGLQQLPAEMERINLHPGAPQYSSQGNSYAPSMDAHYTHHSLAVDPQLPFLGNRKVPVTYEGWTFTKQRPSRPNEKATWALAVKTKMAMSQDELRDQVTKQKKRGKTVTDTYNGSDMEGYKRKQVDRLIADKTRMEVDLRFDHKLASIKLDKARAGSGIETKSMQVILKRVLRSGTEQPLASGQARALELEGEVVDLTGADDIMYSQSSYSGNSPGQYGPPQYPEYVHVQPRDEQPHAAYFPEHAPGIQTVHHHEPLQHQQPEQFMPQHDVHHHQEHYEPVVDHHHHETHNPPKKDKKDGKDGKDGKDKADKKDTKDKKHSHKPEVHQKKAQKPKHYYDSSDSASDGGSSFYTNETANTEFSDRSGDPYHKDKKHSSRRSSRRESRSYDYDLSPTQQVFRERHRKSPARSTHSGHDYEEVEIIPSDHHRDSLFRRNSSYAKERPAHHQRAFSYDDVYVSRPTYKQKRLNSFAHNALDEHPHEEKERLQWEIADLKRQKDDKEERQHKERIEADRLERQRLETERQKLESQKERDKLERLRLESATRYDREREPSRYHRDRDAPRYERDRFERNDRYDRYDPYVDRERERERPRRFSAAFDVRRDEGPYGDPYYR